MAFKAADINIKFEGSGEDERGIDVDSGKTIMRINKKFYRPAEVDLPLATHLMQKTLDWEANTNLEIFNMMVKADIKRKRLASLLIIQMKVIDWLARFYRVSLH